MSDTREEISFDFVVVGGGLAGISAAVAAARGGARTALVGDRPVLGGNSSSEVRVHVGGATASHSRRNVREGGIPEEWRLADRIANHQPGRVVVGARGDRHRPGDGEGGRADLLVERRIPPEVLEHVLLEGERPEELPDQSPGLEARRRGAQEVSEPEPLLECEFP